MGALHFIWTNLVKDVGAKRKLDDAGEEGEEAEDHEQLLVEGAVEARPLLRLEHEHLREKGQQGHRVRAYLVDIMCVCHSKQAEQEIKGRGGVFFGRSCRALICGLLLGYVCSLLACTPTQHPNTAQRQHG